MATIDKYDPIFTYIRNISNYLRIEWAWKCWFAHQNDRIR